jgi:cytidylate kinase
VFAGVVALDGPSGTGKSTVARRLAARLGARYLDTGAMYRAATLAVLRSGVAPDDTEAVARVAHDLDLSIGTDPLAPSIQLDGSDVSAEIRSAEVTRAVSAVSAVPAVREVMVARQRELIGGGGIVVEGRDIGSVVCPDARPKVYLTASAQVRAERRAGELGPDVDVAAVAADIERRDRRATSPATSPMQRAAVAGEVDNTRMDVDAVVDRLAEMAAAVGSDA